MAKEKKATTTNKKTSTRKRKKTKKQEEQLIEQPITPKEEIVEKPEVKEDIIEDKAPKDEPVEEPIVPKEELIQEVEPDDLYGHVKDKKDVKELKVFFDLTRPIQIINPTTGEETNRLANNGVVTISKMICRIPIKFEPKTLPHLSTFAPEPNCEIITSWHIGEMLDVIGIHNNMLIAHARINNAVIIDDTYVGIVKLK